ncbi:DUF3397 family protein [Streptococcus oriscaviae]|uniref:DUF3397 family protein n=1 Tax=Streptococcus oriscaviae TaxID=2781599 RepID=A0ABX7YK25_9STRE|nr:DUF3397 family protein [Streptococcus oriscaviae]QUE54157.1 DUF3397 family protein [Streptococcus oriscaviae]
MIFLKIASILFIFLILTISIILVKLFGLQKKGWNFADLAFPMFVFVFYLISDKVYYNSLLPLLTLSLSLLALAITSFFLLKRRDFTYKRFFKFFWRAGFILTFLLYLALVIAVLTMKN